MSLSADRDTKRIHTASALVRQFPVAADSVIYGGSIVGLKINSGNAVAAKSSYTATDIGVIVGISDQYISNAGGSGGDQVVNVRRCIAKFDNYASDEIGAADVGDACYVYDDYKVAKTSNTNARVEAGRVFQVDDDGVWVEFYK
ncbi:hypothetical protein MCHI_000241 [Candidatus Magnetoovum chiemensis]|nr:hypothetical protein MCHI_000241 [Candidatus Magnetoovum chiemensis]